MRNRTHIGTWIAVLALVLGASIVVAETPEDPPVLTEDQSMEEPVQPDLPLEIFEPTDVNLQPCELPDGTSGAYFCTGTPCSNGQQCARCCSGFNTDCGPLECVDRCFQA